MFVSAFLLYMELISFGLYVRLYTVFCSYFGIGGFPLDFC